MLHRRICQFLLLYGASLVVLFLIKYAGGLSDYVIPSPHEVWRTGREVVARYCLDVFNTLGVAVVGHTLSIALAIVVGILGRLTTWTGALIRAAAFNVQAYPIVAVAPIIFILFGDGIISRLLIASMICYFPLLLSFLSVICEPVTDTEHFYVVTGRNNWRLEVKIRAFENMSKLATVVVGSATLAIVGTIVAEFIAADAGIGYTIRIALYQGDLAKILVALFLIGISTSVYLGCLEWIGHGTQKKWGGVLRGNLIPALALAVAMSAGCSRDSHRQLEPVSYRQKWLFNASAAGDLYAQAHGFFTEQNLDVSIKEGGPERDAIKELELGHAQFGVASADQVIRAVSKGAPIVVIAQLFQINPLQWIFRSERTTIRSPDDLRGKSIGVTYGGNDETILRALLGKFGLTAEDVRLFSVRYDYTPFFQGEVDLWPVYRNAQRVFIGEKLRSAGESMDALNPEIFGIRFVANSVITTARLAEAQPDTAEKFLNALIRGWREALDPANEQQAIETIRRFDRETPVEIVKHQLAATRLVVKPDREAGIGQIDVEAWVETERIMLEQKLIPGPISVKRVLRPEIVASVHP